MLILNLKNLIMSKKNEVMDFCSNCGAETPIDEMLFCGECMKALCPDCICETCENENNELQQTDNQDSGSSKGNKG